jgi:lipopolysaccharide biosynthesis glycosyltransferase
MGLVAQRIDIALGFDERYAPHAAAVMASVVRTAPGAQLRFVALHSGVDGSLRSRIEDVAPRAEFAWVAVEDNDLPPFAERGHFNQSILYRIGLEKLAPADCRRVIYLDSDTIVLGDVRELWGVDLGEYAIGAVVDRYIDAAEFAKRWLLPGENPSYFNSGVLLINLERVRTERAFSAAADFVARCGKDILFGDQDALNWAFWGRWQKLNPAWNVQQYMAREELMRDPSNRGPQLVHFAGWEKPWMPNVWHPWAWLYWQNLLRTPFAADVARQFNMDFCQLMRLRFRWWVKRPRIGLRRFLPPA